MARLYGRLKFGLSPWMRRGMSGFVFPGKKRVSLWSEQWRSAGVWLSSLESALISHHGVVTRGGDYDRWDLEAWCGLLGGVRVLMTTEEHGWGKQLLRFGVRPRVGQVSCCVLSTLGALSFAAALDQAWTASLVLTLMTVFLAVATLRQCGVATNSVVQTIQAWGKDRAWPS